MKLTKFATINPGQFEFTVEDESLLTPGETFSYNGLASFPLFLIRRAWMNGCDFEAEADGYGPGNGTHGDWSGIRDSSSEATDLMFLKALKHFGIIDNYSW